MIDKYLPVKLLKDKKVITTADGTISLYSSSYNESYKTKSVGAFTESYHKFVMQSDIVKRLQYSDIRLLDICFGLGQNIASTIYELERSEQIGNNFHKLHIVSVELDYHLINIVNEFGILSPIPAYNILRKLLKNGSDKNYSLELYIMDAVTLIKKLTGKFDIIYFDPFSKKHNDEMWSLVIFQKLYDILNIGGVLLTYASSKAITEDLISVGFDIYNVKSIGSRYNPSLSAYKNI